MSNEMSNDARMAEALKKDLEDQREKLREAVDRCKKAADEAYHAALCILESPLTDRERDRDIVIMVQEVTIKAGRLQDAVPRKGYGKR